MVQSLSMTSKWQDWASFVLGLWLAVSPWLSGYSEYETATMHAVVVGLILGVGSHFECVACDDMPAEWFNLALGVWLACAPFVLEFASNVGTANSIAVGAVVAALAASALSLDKQLGRLWHNP